MSNCSQCGKKLGFLSAKHKSEDGSIICNPCFKKWKNEQDDKNKKIMIEYISKYLSNKDKDLELSACIFKLREVNHLFESHSLEGVRENFQKLLHEAESSNKSRLSSYEIDEIMSSMKKYEIILDFFDDLEKIYKLFNKKNINADYYEILNLFLEVIETNLDKEYDRILIPVYKRISKRLGNGITKEKVIKEFMNVPLENVYTYDFVSILLDKFNLKYEQKELEQLIEKIKEEVDLEEFELDLGSSQKLDIGYFTQLNGYEFEDYLKNLFKLLDYTVIRTSLSGDQGADLIVSKDNEKTVVQAKKYNEKVSNKAVQEIAAAKNHYKASKAIVVTNSTFTKSAIDLAISNNVELWDGEKLNDIIKNLKNKKKTKELNVSKSFTMEKGKDIQNLKFTCPFCEEEFDYEFDKKQGYDFETKCPHCGFGLSGTGIVTTWGCEYCSEKFQSKSEAEKHEENCKYRQK